MGLYDDFVREFPDMSVEELARKMIEEGHTSGQPRSVKQCIRRARRKYTKESTKESTKRKEDGEGRTNNWREPGNDWYKVEDEWCLFSIDSTPFKMRKLEVEKMIQAYVNEGGGYTTDQLVIYMGRHFDRELTPDFAARILRVLGITHKSPPLAPWEVDNLDEDEGAEKWFNIKMAGIDQKYRQKRPKKMERELKKERNKTLEAQELARSILGEMESIIPEFEMRTRAREVVFQDAEPHVVSVVISDWHLGKVIDFEVNEYNKNVFWDRLFRLEKELYEYFQVECNRPVERVRVLVPGDMVDGVLGNMHDQQQLGQDLHGLEQAVTAAWGQAYIVRAIAEMTDAEVIVDSTGGNHGRTSSSREFDRNRFAENLTYFCAKLMCQTDERILWRIHESEVVVPISEGNTKILLTHGDRCPSNARDLVWPYRDESQYYMIVTGHLHSYEANEDLDIFSLRAGSLCGASEYSVERLGKGAKPSQAIFSIRGDGPRMGEYLPLE